MSTRLVLIRHGITRWNKQRRYCGHTDVALSKEGKIQAAKLARRLKALKFDRIYSSSSKRAIQTARIIFGKAGITRVKELKELNFGLLEGLKHEHILKEYAKAYSLWLQDPFKNTLPKGESLNVFRKRVNSALTQILKANCGKTVAVVCHGGTISMFITGILKKKSFWDYVPGSASISIVEYSKNKAELKLVNCTKHLR